MIRPFTCLSLLAAFGSGMYLYAEKHRAELLERQIAHVMHETEAARQRAGLLRADWALLNDPTRLQDMADKYLALKPMAPSQFVQLGDLSNHLPAVVVAPAGGAADDDAVAQDAPAPAANEAAVSSPAAPEAAPVVRLAEKQVPATTAHAGTKVLAHAAPKKPQHQVAVADRGPPIHNGPMAPSGPLPLASPQPMGARVMSAMAHPGHLSARPAVVSAVPSALGAAYVGSALGGRTSLPPPVPLGAQ
jgi:hypothetical protein